MKLNRNVFGAKTNHVRHVHLQLDMNNNEMEKLSGTIRDSEKAFIGLGSMSMPVFEGMKVYYNHQDYLTRYI